MTAHTDFPMYRHVERQASRMHEMMHELDVDPLKLARLQSGNAYAEARSRCLHCAEAHGCLYWLESAAHDGGELPGFCPNLELFRTCRRG